MRYIRTKRNDYLVADLNELTICEHLYGKPYKDKHGFLIYPHDIVKQADTIEELCDWYVYREDGRIKYLFKDWKTAVSYLGQCFEISDYQNWYGAIETSKGLTYVAKMNEKGELELL